MRAGKCVLCGAALPEGGRRDRRYCEESCRAMAYRKRRGAATAETGRPPSGAHAASGTDLAPVVLAIAQQLKQLQQDMESVKKRLADLEAQALAQSARPAPMVEQAREVVQTLQSLFGAGQAPPKSESSAPSAPAVPAVPAVPAAPEPSILAPSVPPQGASPHTEAPTTKLPPWMAASPKNATQFVPQWTLWSSDFLDRLNAHVDRMLGNVPDVLAAQGETQAAEKMRQWLASDKPLAMQVASLMARRIVATPPAVRESAQQRLDLARMVAKDIEESLSSEPQEDKQRMASMLSQDPRLPVLMGVFLTVALRSLAGVPATANV